MAKVVTLNAEKRTEMGTTACRRLRRQGMIPANIYGHEIDPVAVTLDGNDLRPVISSGAHVVDLSLDGQTEKALIRDVQWDTFSTAVQHIDLLRVDETERVQVNVPINLRGTAPGVLANGRLDQPMHSLSIECPAVEIPDGIDVRINQLEIGESIQVKDLQDLQEGLTVLDSPEAVIVHIIEALVEEEEEAPEEAAEAAGAEPEVIGRPPEEAGDSE